MMNLNPCLEIPVLVFGFAFTPYFIWVATVIVFMTAFVRYNALEIN